MENFVNEYFTTLSQIAMHYALSNYDYCYLDAMHRKNRIQGTTTIIAGSSHAMNGVAESELPEGAINFSISSQDLYFDFLNIKKAVEEGKQKIQNCVINIGYYMLHQDLSRSTTMWPLMRDVYGPLFGDTHNYEGEVKTDTMEEYKKFEKFYSGDLLRTVCTEFAGKLFQAQGSYYGSVKTREQNSILPVSGIIWEKLTEQERDAYAQKRCADHNRLKKHTASREENGKIVAEMAEYLYAKDIKTVFVVFPFTRFYNKYINPEYREDIYALLDSLPREVGYLDMNDYGDLFGDDDFLDTDHLKLQGAVKASRLLHEFLTVSNG